MTNLEENFKTFWTRIHAAGNPKEAYRKLQTEYSNPNRTYHNFKHIEDCFKEFNQVRTQLNNPNAVEFAIWYHDIIYDTQSKDNEEKSAQLAYETCIKAKLPEPFAKTIKDLVLATKHNSIPQDRDSKYLIDIDLTILGKSTEEFNVYEKSIRKEYSWVPEDQFKEGRTKILQMFLDRPSIYSTKYFKNKYEKQARINLEMSIMKLK